MIDQFTEQRIKDAANIVDIVGDYVELRKRGREWEGLCPFHDDHRLGSFKVNEVKNIAKCFSCGKSLDPVGFVMEMENLDYPTALRWLAKRYGIYLEGEEEINVKPSAVAPRPKLPELKMLTIDRAWVRESIGELKYDVLYKWICSLPWSDGQRRRINDVAWLYVLGRWKNDGRTVFWQIDERGNVHSGKLMSYAADGHRIKTIDPTFVHYDPALHIDHRKFAFKSCLFGQHLLKRYPKSRVHIVESEKSAIICAIHFGMNDGLWLACGGLEYLKPRHLQPLIDEGRKIWLWPDKDGEAKWRKFLDDIKYDKIAIYNKFLTECWAEADGDKADIADIIVRTLNNPEQNPSL